MHSCLRCAAHDLPEEDAGVSGEEVLSRAHCSPAVHKTILGSHSSMVTDDTFPVQPGELCLLGLLSPKFVQDCGAKSVESRKLLVY